MEIMPRQSCAKFLRRYFDFCHALHFFLPQSFVDWVAMEKLPFGFRWQGNVPIQYARCRSILLHTTTTPMHCKLYFEKLRTVCRNVAESVRKIVSTAPAMGANILRKFAEIAKTLIFSLLSVFLCSF